MDQRLFTAHSNQWLTSVTVSRFRYNSPKADHSADAPTICRQMDAVKRIAERYQDDEEFQTNHVCWMRVCKPSPARRRPLANQERLLKLRPAVLLCCPLRRVRTKLLALVTAKAARACGGRVESWVLNWVRKCLGWLGKSSWRRASSQRSRAWAWHLGQCRFRTKPLRGGVTRLFVPGYRARQRRSNLTAIPS